VHERRSTFATVLSASQPVGAGCVCRGGDARLAAAVGNSSGRNRRTATGARPRRIQARRRAKGRTGAMLSVAGAPRNARRRARRLVGRRASTLPFRSGRFEQPRCSPRSADRVLWRREGIAPAGTVALRWRDGERRVALRFSRRRRGAARHRLAARPAERRGSEGGRARRAATWAFRSSRTSISAGSTFDLDGGRVDESTPTVKPVTARGPRRRRSSQLHCSAPRIG
jgi:hypothetical protein